MSLSRHSMTRTLCFRLDLFVTLSTRVTVNKFRSPSRGRPEKEAGRRSLRFMEREWERMTILLNYFTHHIRTSYVHDDGELLSTHDAIASPNDAGNVIGTP